MISQLKLHNFKAFENLLIDLRPITLFFGPNNSGKSSILASIRLLTQTIESFDPQVVLLLNGIMGDFGTYKDIVFGNHRGRPLEISISFKPTFQKSGEVLQKELWPSAYDNYYKLILEYKYRTIRREIILREVILTINNEPHIIVNYSLDSERHTIEQIGLKTFPPSMKSHYTRLMRMDNFLPHLPSHRFFFTKERSSLSEFLTKNDLKKIDSINTAVRAISKDFHNIDYIGAMRVSPQRTYIFTGEKRGRIGPLGENAANIFVMDELRSGVRKLNISRNVSSWLRKAGIASNLQMHQISDLHFELKVKHPVTGENQNIADVGYGNSQIFPVLVGGYNLQEGSIYIVEEPEIHLHPRAQAELGEFFYDLYKRGIQSIVETHSEHLILRLQQHVAAGNIPFKQINIFYVYSEEGQKIVKRLRLDEKGKFIDEWPGGFFPERLQEAQKLSKIRLEKEIRK